MPGSSLPYLSQEEEQAHEDQDDPGIDRIHECRASQSGNQQATQGRAKYRGQLPNAAIPRRGILEGILRNDLWNQRRSGRAIEGSRAAIEHQAAVDQHRRSTCKG